MIIRPITENNKNFESALEKNIDEAATFFKNEGILYEIALKHEKKPKQFKDALREYIKLKFGEEKCEEVIKHIPRMIMKYDKFFEEGKSSYKNY